MKDWCIRLSGVSEEQIRFALKELHAVMGSYAHGQPSAKAYEDGMNAVCLSVRKDSVPANGYRVKIEEPSGGRQRVFIDGSDPEALTCGVMDFCHRCLPRAAVSHTTADPYYFRALFEKDFLPPEEYDSAPRIPKRGLWTWGRAVYDWHGYLENMARLRLNELILWNDFAPLNGQDIVSYAHELGIRVIWGYAWGWDTAMRLDTSEEAAQRIIDKYEEEYSDLGGDGIYFQSFTETSRETLDGVLIAEAVTEFVNRTAAKLLQRHPGLRLQFGLHADSVKNRLEAIAKVDPRIEIIWENCGGFPYHASPGVIGDTVNTKAFTEKLLALRPGAATGAVLKSMIQLNWPAFTHQAGPERLGCADEKTIQARFKDVRRIWRYISAEWLDHGEMCRDVLRLYARKEDTAVYCLVEDGLFEREIPLPAALYAALAWNWDQDWRTLVRETVLHGQIRV
ncbi:MAG: hypothetical protein IKX84_07815 [Clostridia bacterium]|nr:hypothetical protein [Clostridia bacterium]